MSNQREAKRKWAASQSKSDRDIGPLREAADELRKESCRLDFRLFCLTYFPWLFPLPFSADHLKVIAKIETSVLRGGLFAVAMPRGSGKTTLSECAVLWALIYGHRTFVVLIGAEAGKSAAMLDSIKMELETNAALSDDFPEVCQPIEALERIANRCKGQTLDGTPTYIVWTADAVVLPTVPGAQSSGGVAMVGGLTASLRGLKLKRADGRAVRPDFVVIDDPQTDESARSPSQCATRERIIAGAILGMAGPGKKIAGVMPCTVIVPGDLADNLLSPDKHPAWRGERTKILYAMPTNMEQWQRYSELRSDSLRHERGGVEATEYYAARREVMDAGAIVAWPERIEPDCISALQYAMNIYFDRPEVFAAEYQNDPLPIDKPAPGNLTTAGIVSRLNNHARGLTPGQCSRLTGFIDVHKELLYWCVCGWGDGFTGAVIDYGTWPDQQRDYFALADARPTLAAATGVTSTEGALWAGLTATVAHLAREWSVDGGGMLRVDRILIDSGWGEQSDLVKRFCRQSPSSAIVWPSKGVGITAGKSPMSDWAKHDGERRGLNWLVRPPKTGQGRTVLFDSNFWKTFLAARLSQAQGEAGAMTLFGADAGAHRLFADHLTAEYSVSTARVETGRRVDQWNLRPGRDNHWLDCLTGCFVAASIQGAAMGGDSGAKPAERKRISYAELQQRARAGR